MATTIPTEYRRTVAPEVGFLPTPVQQYVLPPLELLKAGRVRKAGQNYLRILEDFRAANRAYAASEDEIRRATIEDIERLGEALHVGKADPGQRAEEAAREKAAEALRRRNGLAAALRRATEDLIAAVESVREEWLADLRAGVQKARDDYSAAVVALDARRRDLAAAESVVRFVQGFPERRIFAVKGLGSVTPAGGTWESMIEALMGVVAPPRPYASTTEAHRGEES